ncbi:hypothetical protein GJ496_007250 [Pomphorhynchus laevis]|nr:hypothetical protein GJ496_007250 [Pomphorhynchus laevis]
MFHADIYTVTMETDVEKTLTKMPVREGLLGCTNVKVSSAISFKKFKPNIGVAPLLLCVGFGTTIAMFTLFRTILRSPEFSIRYFKEKPYEKFVDESGKGIPYKLYLIEGYENVYMDPDRPNIKS